MITIRIFLASSITEFSSERRELGAFINSLNTIYVKKGIFFELIICEDLSNAVQSQRSQDIYNQEIRDSQYFYVIFGLRAGRFTIEEFEVALSSFREKGEPHIYTYFIAHSEEEQPDQSVIDFMRRLENELQHFHNRYIHIDSIKLNLLMELARDARVGGTVTLENGQAQLDGTDVISMANIPVYSRNAVIQKLLSERKDLEQEYVALAGLADSDAVQRLRLRNSTRRNEIDSQLHALEMDVLGLCRRMEENRQSGKRLNWREAKALELADGGDYEAAKTLLRDEQWRKEVARAEETIESAKETIREYISGKQALIQMISASGITKDNEREIREIYDDICYLAARHMVMVDVLYRYAQFLYDQKQYNQAKGTLDYLFRLTQQAGLSMEQRANDHNLLGLVNFAQSRFADAETAYLQARAIWEKLSEESPAAYLSSLATVCNNLGYLYQTTSRFGKAEAEMLRAKEIWGKMSEENPAAWLPSLAIICNNLGRLYEITSRFGEAETELLKAKEIRRKLAGDNPSAWLPDLATSCNNLGMLYKKTSHYEQAEAEYLQAKEIREKLARENPAAWLPDLANSCNNLGSLYEILSRFGEAETELVKAKEIREKLAGENPGAYLSYLATSCNNLGNLYRGTSRFGQAETELVKAKEIWVKLSEENPAAWLPYLATVCNNLGRLYEVTSCFPKAEAECLQAKEIREKLAEENPAAYSSDLAISCNNLGSLYQSMSRFEKAEAAYGQAKAIWEKLAEKSPAAYLPYLALICSNLGSLLIATSRFGEAEAEYLQAKRTLISIYATNPAACLADLADVCSHLHTVYEKTGRPEEAAKEAAQAKGYREQLEKLKA